MQKRDYIWLAVCVNAVFLSWLYWRGEVKEKDRQVETLQGTIRGLEWGNDNLRKMNSRLP